MSPRERRSRTGGKSLGGILATVVVATVLVGGASLIPGSTPTSPPPSGQGSCPLPAFPDASCTGVPDGVTLTAYTGPSNITTPNTVIDGKLITTCLNISASGVIIRNSRIRASGCGVFIDTRNFTSTALLVEDSEFDCMAVGGTAIYAAWFTLRRVDIKGCENGLSVDEGVIIEDSYIHDLYNGGAAHMDGIQLSTYWTGTTWGNNARNLTVRHNTIYAIDPQGSFGTSAIISNGGGGDENILIEDNLFAGGAYTIYCTGWQGNFPGNNYRLLNNRFSQQFKSTVGEFGPSNGCGNNITKSGNVYYPSGLPVNLG